MTQIPNTPASALDTGSRTCINDNHPRNRLPLEPTHLLFAVAIALAAAQSLHAQGTWPDKPVHIVVPQPPGGVSDIVLRSAIDKMQPVLKQSLIIDSKPGAAGNLGAAGVARAAPDGQTWLWTTDTLMTVNPHVYPNLGFKPEDLVPVMRASSFSQTLVCNPGLGVKTVADLVGRAKSKRLSYASGGAGSPGHLSSELFKSVAGIDMIHVPYKGPAPAARGAHLGRGRLSRFRRNFFAGSLRAQRHAEAHRRCHVQGARRGPQGP